MPKTKKLIVKINHVEVEGQYLCIAPVGEDAIEALSNHEQWERKPKLVDPDIECARRYDLGSDRHWIIGSDGKFYCLYQNQFSDIV